MTMLKQYMHWRERNSEGVSFFRMGDLWYAIGDDAYQVVSAVPELELVSLKTGRDTRIDAVSLNRSELENVISVLIETDKVCIVEEYNEHKRNI